MATDYSALGSFATGAAAGLNGDLSKNFMMQNQSLE